MAKLLILGSSNAVPDEKHENTHMAVIGSDHFILIDCVNNPIVRIKQVGLDFNELTDIIITHFHPDHVSGVPLLLMSMWLKGRKSQLNIYGLDYTLERLEKLMEFYDWQTWPNFYPVHFHRLPEEEKTPVLENQEFRILASPVHHLVPNIGLRVEFLDTGKAMAYSCDTEPCKEVENLADGVDVLIHEAAGEALGHSSAAQAGEVATRAETASLFLIHYPTGDFDSQSLVKEAKTTYQGPVALAEDFMVLNF